MKKRFLSLAVLLMPGMLFAQKQLNVSLSKTQKVYPELQKVFKASEIYKLESFQNPSGNENEILINLGNENLRFAGAVDRHLSEGLTLKVDGRRQASPNLPVLFNGDEKSGLRLGLNDNFVMGSFKRNGEDYMMEMATNFAPEAGSNEVVVYRVSDVSQSGGVTCGVSEMAGTAQRTQEAVATSSLASCYLMEIGLVLDSRCYSRHGSVSALTNHFLSMYNLSEAQFSSGLAASIRFRINEMVVFTTPQADAVPFDQELMNMYTGFMNLGMTNLFDHSNDITSYWTSQDGGGTVGWSYLGMMCPGANIYKETGMVAAKMRNLISHEIGHLFGCNHTDGYIMSAIINDDANWAQDSKNVINSRLNSGLPCLEACTQTSCETSLTSGVNVVKQGANYVISWASSSNTVRVETQTSGAFSLEGNFAPGTTSTSVPIPTSCDSIVTRFKISTVCPNSGLGVSTIVSMLSGKITPKLNYSGTIDFCAVDGIRLSVSPDDNSLRYQWYRDGVAISGATSSTYTAPQAGAYYCTVSNGSCPSNSNTVSLRATGNITASIEASDLNVCPNTSVRFIATTNANNASYQWKKNGVNVGTNSPEYSSTQFVTGDVISCVVTGLNGCSNRSVTSNTLRMDVSGAPSLSASITAPNGTSVCNSGMIYLKGQANNTSGVTYQWYRNGSPVGINSPELYFPGNGGGAFYLNVTQNINCGTTISANSNTINITGMTGPAISAYVTMTPSGAACSSTPRTFTVTTNVTNASYQWEINGNMVYGATQSTFTATDFNNGDLVRVTVNPSQTPCYATAGYRTENITVRVSNSAVTNPTLSIASDQLSVCGAATRTFTSSISATGATYQWKRNDVNISGATSASYSSASLLNGDVITLVATLPASGCFTTNTVTSNALTLSTSASVTPTATVSATPVSGCASTVRTFSVNTNITGGTYRWQRNGINISGATSATYSASGFTNGTNISVVVTVPSGGCYTSASVTSANFAVSVSSAVVPTVSVTQQPPVNCSSTSRTFNATTNIENASFRWRRNGYTINGATGESYTSSNLSNGDNISVIATAPAGSCYTSTSVTSANSMVTANAMTVPAATVSVTPVSGCATTTRNFTAATNITGGTYQWKKNGQNISGATGTTYSAAGFVDGDDVQVTITAPSGACYTANSVTSQSVILQVTPSQTPTAVLSVTPQSVCSNTPRVFSVTSNATPSAYLWRKNGVTISGQTGETLTLSNLLTTDAISVQLSFDNTPCVTSTRVISNNVSIQNSSQTATVSASVDVASSCASAARTFTAITNVSGATYQWQRNYANINGATSATYTTGTVSNGDYFRVRITAPSGSCYTNSTVYSSNVFVYVTASTAPTASVTVSPASGCASVSRTFTSTTNVSGATYQWQKNNSNIPGATSATYSASGFSNGDQVRVVVTAPAGSCYTSASVTSSSTSISVTSSVTPTVSVSASPTTGCATVSRTFTATTNVSGATYQWQKNTVNIAGATASSYSASNFSNGDQVRVIVTTPSGGCFTTSSVTSASSNVSVSGTITPTASVSVSPQTGCSNVSRTFTASTNVTGGTYQWYKNNVLISGANGATYNASGFNNNDQVKAIVTAPSGGCYTTSSASATVNVGVTASQSAPAVFIYVSPSTTQPANAMRYFSMNATPAGSTYQWYKNNVAISGAVSSTYSASGFNNNDKIKVIVTLPTSACYNNATVTSNTLTLKVSGSASLRSTIAQIGDNTCEGTQRVFKVTPEVPNAIYAWELNGDIVGGAISSSFTTSNLQQGDVLRCITFIPGTNSFPVYSNNLAVEVQPALEPDVKLVMPAQAVMEGEAVSFYANAENGGDASVFKWFVNDQLVETGSQSFTTVLNNSSYIKVVMRSSETCLTKLRDTSMNKLMRVNKKGRGSSASENNTSSLQLRAYPNPATDFVIVTGIGNSGFTEAVLRNQQGVIMQKISIENGKDIRIQRTNAMKAGLYYLTLQRNGGSVRTVSVLFR